MCVFFWNFCVHTNEGFNSEIDQTAAEPEHMRFCCLFWGYVKQKIQVQSHLFFLQRFDQSQHNSQPKSQNSKKKGFQNDGLEKSTLR